MTTVERADEALAVLDAEPVDCIVSEYDLPDIDGVRLLEALRSNRPELPFVLVVADGSEEIASEAIAAGVTAYVRKGANATYERLENRMVDAVETDEHRRGESERRERQQSLEAARARFRSLTENTTLGVVAIDADSTVRYANDAVSDLFGYAPEELVGESLAAVIPDRLETPHFEALGRYIETGTKTLDWEWIELPARHRDGHEFPVGVSFGEYVADGEHLLTGVIRDITDRKRRERDLEQYEAIIESMDDAVYVLDERGRFEFVNEAFSGLTGYDIETILGGGVEIIKDEQTVGTFETILGEMLSSGIAETTVEFEIRTANGDRIPCEDHLVPRLIDGEFRGVVGTIRDVTERRARGRELERSRDLLERTQQVAAVGGWEFDCREGELRWTDEVYRIHGLPFGYEPELADALSFYHPEDAPIAENAVENAIENGESFDIELRLVAADDTVRWVRAQGDPRNKNGEPVRLRGAFQDITDRKRHERTLTALHDATRDLMAAGTPEEIATIAIETTAEVLDHPLVGVHYYDPAVDGLVPVAWSQQTEAIVGQPPTFEAGTGLAWEAFETGESAVYGDIRDTGRVHNPETPIRSGMNLPLGDHGVFLVGSTDADDFEESDLALANVLAANVEAAIGRSDREQALRDRETQLARERDRFAAMFDYIPDPAVTVDTGDGDLLVTSANGGFEDVFGYDSEAVIGESLNDLIVPSERMDEAMEIDRAAQRGEQLMEEVRRRTKSGELRDFLFRNVPIDTHGNETFGIYTDITERREHESYRRRLYEIGSDTELSSEQKVRRTLELGCAYLDMESAFLTRIDEDTQRIVESHSPHELIQPGEECPLSSSYCRRTIEVDGPMIVEHAGDDWKGDPAYERFGFESYVGSKLTIDGGRYGTVAFADRSPREAGFSNLDLAFIDLLVRGIASELERRRHERELERQNERLEEFASVVSHDLRNPLTIASGYLDIVETDDEEHLETIRRAHGRMERIIEDVLALARQGKSIGETRSVSPAAVAETAWEHAETTDARLLIEDDAGAVMADRSRLEALFENLFRNAIEHGSDEATCRVGPTTDGFYVEDDGPGVPADERDAVFEYGHTTTDSGTGLGLSIVDTIVDAHGWAITLTDGESGGARFEISL